MMRLSLGGDFIHCYPNYSSINFKQKSDRSGSGDEIRRNSAVNTQAMPVLEPPESIAQ
jgi:hypothetical protein